MEIEVSESFLAKLNQEQGNRPMVADFSQITRLTNAKVKEIVERKKNGEEE